MLCSLLAAVRSGNRAGARQRTRRWYTRTLRACQRRASFHRGVRAARRLADFRKVRWHTGGVRAKGAGAAKDAGEELLQLPSQLLPRHALQVSIDKPPPPPQKRTYHRYTGGSGPEIRASWRFTSKHPPLLTLATPSSRICARPHHLAYHLNSWVSYKMTPHARAVIYRPKSAIVNCQPAWLFACLPCLLLIHIPTPPTRPTQILLTALRFKASYGSPSASRVPGCWSAPRDSGCSSAHLSDRLALAARRRAPQHRYSPPRPPQQWP